MSFFTNFFSSFKNASKDIFSPTKAASFPLLKIKDLCVCYGSKSILHEISLTADGGEILSFIGPNGSGKSTLMKAIMNWISIKEGQIFIQGKNLKQSSHQFLSKHLAYVPQYTERSRIQLTVFEILLISLRAFYKQHVPFSQLKDTIGSMLHELEIEHLTHRYIGELSGGEYQMLSIVQALIRNPKILLLDEPNNTLDLKYQMYIFEWILNYTRKNKILSILTLHDLNLVARFADKVLVLKEGKAYAFGEKEHILNSSMLKQIYEIHSKVYKDKEGLSYVQILSSLRTQKLAKF